MDELQANIWKQLLDSASEFTDQINNPGKWAEDFLNKPLYQNQKEIVDAVVDLNKGYISILGARGSGKSWGAVVGLIKLCCDYPEIEIGLFGPRTDQASRLIGEMKKILVKSKIAHEVNWDRTTTDKLFFKNGANILALSAAETSLQEGWHFDVIVVDEAHRVTNASMSERILPMLGSKKIYKVIKIGIPMFKNHFYKSFSDEKYEVLCHDWLHSPILLEAGITAIKEDDGTETHYPAKVLDRMPKSLKVKMFPENEELHFEGDMTEIEFNTQYGMIWMDDINSFLQGDEPETLVGTHPIIHHNNAGEEYYYGFDTSSGTLIPGKADLDFTALCIWRRKNDGDKEKIFCKEWQGGETLSQIEEVARIVHPTTGTFPCTFGCIDYSNVGITAVEMFKRLKIPAAGVLFSQTEQSSKKNFKNAMAHQMKFELQADRVKYPKLEDIEQHRIFRKHYHQWLALERNVTVGLNDKIEAPKGLHDDGVMADLLAIWACDKSMTFKKMRPIVKINSVVMPRSIFSANPKHQGGRFLGQ